MRLKTFCPQQQKSWSIRGISTVKLFHQILQRHFAGQDYDELQYPVVSLDFNFKGPLTFFSFFLFFFSHKYPAIHLMTVKQSFYLISKSDSVLYLRQVISSEEYCPILSHEQFCTLSINRESLLTNTIRAIADELTKLVISKSPGFVQVLCYLCVTNDSLERESSLIDFRFADF